MTSRDLLLNEYARVSLSEVAAASGFGPHELRELVELGVLEPSAEEGAEYFFAARAIETARVARRLQLDFELPLAGVALALAYRERVRELEGRLRLLECHLPGQAHD